MIQTGGSERTEMSYTRRPTPTHIYTVYKSVGHRRQEVEERKGFHLFFVSYEGGWSQTHLLNLMIRAGGETESHLSLSTSCPASSTSHTGRGRGGGRGRAGRDGGEVKGRGFDGE
jgi:hypothetical protein